ncbi:pectate lyase [Geosmithia morbida]|uniref:Pectate lyase n=1 Tax=Geosmithia morbida TaxID=1094350 RepID=A0A9P4YQ28_9HYPO|nr:pectate lyase [Geosmithia morbida]KAF4121041.1 pectate lyase [Geosmithia morbida]
MYSATLLLAGSGMAMAASQYFVANTTSPLIAAAVTSTIPEPAGTSLSSEPISVSGSFDGKGFLYDRDSVLCNDQQEGGDDDTIFLLEDGASLSNVIIGPNQAEGIHCAGSCTLTNVWFQDVCEDAISLKGDGDMTISGGGAFHASDKVIQLNGIGQLTVDNFYVEDYGKLVRSCGNCDGNGGPRNIEISNVVAIDGGPLCGINTNYGDTCDIVDSCQDSGESCTLYTGNDTGDEPEEVGEGPDGKYCVTENFKSSC